MNYADMETLLGEGMVTQNGDAIELIYDLILDPSRFPELIDILGKSTNRSADDRLDFTRHIRRACAMYDRLQPDEYVDEFETLLAREQQPGFLVSREGLVITANELALAAYGAKPGDGLADLLYPYESIEPLEAVLYRLAGKVISSDDNGEILKLEEPTSGKPMLLSLTPIQTKEDIRVVLVRTPMLVWSDGLREGLCRIFGLTEAELAVIEALLLGHDPANIAALRDTQISTVRAQLRALFMKTGTKGQSELIQIVFGLSRLVAAGASTGDPDNVASENAEREEHPVPPPPDRRYTSHGRAAFERGSPDGEPILAFHDELVGDAFLLPLIGSSKGRSLRFIVAPRPGYGQAKPISDDGLRAQAVTRLHEEIVSAARPGGPIAIVTHGNGLYFALLFARQHSEKVRRIVAIRPMMPVRVADALDDMPRYNSLVTSAARKNDNLLEFILRAGFALYRQVGARRFAQMVFTDAADRRLLSSKELLASLEQGASLAGGRHHGLLADEKSVRGDWSGLFAECRCSIRLLVGDSDRSRLWRAERIAQENRHVLVQSIAGTSQLAAFGNPDLVIEALAAQPCPDRP